MRAFAALMPAIRRASVVSSIREQETELASRRVLFAAVSAEA